MGRSRLRGVSNVRRLMRGMPQAVQSQIVEALDDTGRKIAPTMRRRAGRRTGNLQGGISFKVFPKTLRLQVGVLGKKAQQRLFYGRILDKGRKGQAVKVSRRTKGGSVSSYTMNVRPLRGRYFITGSYRDMRGTFTQNLNGIWDRAVADAAGGIA